MLKTLKPWIILAIVAACFQLFILLTLPPILMNDTTWYFQQSHFFNPSCISDFYAAGAAKNMDIYHPPGYPLFIDACRLLFGERGWLISIILIQHALSLLSVIFLYQSGKNLTFKKAGFFAALVYALYLPRALYAQTLMAESLMTFGLLASIYFFTTYLKKPTGFKIAVVSTIVFFTIITKALAIALLPLFILLLLFPNGKLPTRFPTHVLIFTGAFFLLMSIFLWHNKYYYGKASLSTASGRHLATRVFGYDRLINKEDAPTKTLLQKLESARTPCFFPEHWWFYLRALRENGESIGDTEKLLSQSSVAAIRRYWFVYIGNTACILFMNIAYDDQWIGLRSYFLYKENYKLYLENANYRPTIGYIPEIEFKTHHKLVKTLKPYDPPRVFGKLGDYLIRIMDTPELKLRHGLSFLLFFGIGYGLFFAPASCRWLAWVIVSISLVPALTEHPYARYFEPLMPVSILLSSIGLSELFKNKIPGFFIKR